MIVLVGLQFCITVCVCVCVCVCVLGCIVPLNDLSPRDEHGLSNIAHFNAFISKR